MMSEATSYNDPTLSGGYDDPESQQAATIKMTTTTTAAGSTTSTTTTTGDNNAAINDTNNTNDDELIAKMMADDLNGGGIAGGIDGNGGADGDGVVVDGELDDLAIARMIADSEYAHQNYIEMVNQQRTQHMMKWFLRVSVLLVVGIVTCGTFVLLTTFVFDDNRGSDNNNNVAPLLTLESLLAPSTSKSVINDPTSPQNKAWIWLQTQHTNDTLALSKEPNIRESLIEAFAITTIYYSTGGSFSSWKNKYEFTFINLINGLQQQSGNAASSRSATTTISPCYWQEELQDFHSMEDGEEASGVDKDEDEDSIFSRTTITCNIHSKIDDERDDEDLNQEDKNKERSKQHPTITELDLSKFYFDVLWAISLLVFVLYYLYLLFLLCSINFIPKLTNGLRLPSQHPIIHFSKYR